MHATSSIRTQTARSFTAKCIGLAVLILLGGAIEPVTTHAQAAHHRPTHTSFLSKLDAKIKVLISRISKNTLSIGALQKEAKRIDRAAYLFDNSPHEIRAKNDVNAYRVRCAGKRLYGSQIGFCNSWAARAQGELNAHNGTMNHYMSVFASTNRKIRSLQHTVAIDRTRLAKLQKARSTAVQQVSTGSHIFGSKGTPKNPGLQATAPAPSVAVHSAREQLSSTSKSSNAALGAGSAEQASTLARCGFDNAPCRAPDAIKVPKAGPQTPAAAELATHIPDAPEVKNSPVVQGSLAWFEKLEKIKFDDQRKIAEIDKKIANHQGDAAVLAAHKATLENNINREIKDLDDTKKQIKTELVKLHHPWIEAPSTKNAAGGKAGQ